MTLSIGTVGGCRALVRWYCLLVRWVGMGYGGAVRWVREYGGYGTLGTVGTVDGTVGRGMHTHPIHRTAITYRIVPTDPTVP